MENLDNEKIHSNITINAFNIEWCINMLRQYLPEKVLFLEGDMTDEKFICYAEEVLMVLSKLQNLGEKDNSEFIFQLELFHKQFHNLIYNNLQYIREPRRTYSKKVSEKLSLLVNKFRPKKSGPTLILKQNAAK